MPREASTTRKHRAQPKAKPEPKVGKAKKPEKETPVRKNIESILLSDLVAAVRAAFSSGGARDRKTAIRDVARELQYSRVTPRVEKAVDKALRAAVHRGVIRKDGPFLQSDCRFIKDYSRDALVKHLLEAVGRSWWGRGEAAYWTAWHLGYRRVSASMYATLKSAITTAVRRGLLERDGDRIRKCRE